MGSVDAVVLRVARVGLLVHPRDELLQFHRLDPPLAAAADLVRAVKDTVGVSVRCEVVDPDTLERSVGKLQRLRDLRAKS